MRTLLLAVAIVAASAGIAGAEICDARELWHRAEMLVHRLIGNPPPDRDVIVAPRDLDARMSLTPPAVGTLRVIRPPDPRGR